MNQQQIETLLDAWYAVHGDTECSLWGTWGTPEKRVDGMMLDYVETVLRHTPEPLSQHKLFHYHPPFVVMFVFGGGVRRVRVKLQE